MTVGGSYPGFLSSVMRIAYPSVVDIGYASSAPLQLYDHNHGQYVYFDKITEVADSASPGCAKQVKATLLEAQQDVLSSKMSVEQVAAEYGICTETLPGYIRTTDVLFQEIALVVAAHFADLNMVRLPARWQACRRSTISLWRINTFSTS
jgi:hypothetical protein